jgi:hypothetical protein
VNTLVVKTWSGNKRNASRDDATVGGGAAVEGTMGTLDTFWAFVGAARGVLCIVVFLCNNVKMRASGRVFVENFAPLPRKT